MSSSASLWPVAELGDLATDETRAITDGPFGSNLARKHYTTSGPRVIRLQNIGDGVFIDAPAHISIEHFNVLRAHEAKAGDLVIASLGEFLPRACLVPDWLGPAIVKADCIRVRLGKRVEPRWVLYALQSPRVRAWAEQHRHGVGRPRLGMKAIKKLPIPLPSLSEQRRIVDILEDHLSRLDAAESGLALTRARLSSLMERMVISALLGDTVQGERANANLQPAGTVDGDLADLPSGWTWRRLGELAEVVGGVTKDAKRQADPAYVEVPYLRVANVQRGYLDLENVVTIRVPSAKSEALRLLPGDVLMNEGGDRDKLARGWVWEGQIENCIHQNHVFRARVSENSIDSRLLSWAANTIGAKWAERNGRQSVNLASISLSAIRRMPVPVPPIKLQPKIVAQITQTLEATRRLDASVDNRLRQSGGLRRALLAAAFSGRLTGRSNYVDEVEESTAVAAS